LTSLFDTAFKLITANNTANINSATVSNLNLPTNKIQNKQIYSHLACQLDNYNILQMKYLAYNLLTFVSDLIMSEAQSSVYSALAARCDDQGARPATGGHQRSAQVPQGNSKQIVRSDPNQAACARPAQ